MDVLEKVRSTLGTYSGEDVRSMLKEDHEVILDLAKELAETTSGARRRTLVTQLKPLLIAHSRAEEQAVYVPLTELRDSPDSRLAGSEGAVEHSLVDILLGRMFDTKDTATDMWRAHAKVLHESLDHHIKEEEGAMFEELGEHFSEEERTSMGARFEQRRAELLAEIGAADPLARKKG